MVPEVPYDPIDDVFADDEPIARHGKRAPETYGDWLNEPEATWPAWVHKTHAQRVAAHEAQRLRELEEERLAIAKREEQAAKVAAYVEQVRQEIVAAGQRRVAAASTPHTRAGDTSDVQRQVAAWWLTSGITLVFGAPSVAAPILEQRRILAAQLEANRAAREAARLAAKTGALLRLARNESPPTIPDHFKPDWSPESVGRWLDAHRDTCRATLPWNGASHREIELESARWDIFGTIQRLTEQNPDVAGELRLLAEQALIMPLPKSQDATEQEQRLAEQIHESMETRPVLHRPEPVKFDAPASDDTSDESDDDHDDEDEGHEETEQEIKRKRLRQRITSWVRKFPGCGNQLLRDKIKGVRGVDVVAAARAMEEEGLLKNAGTKTRPVWHAIDNLLETYRD